MSDNATLVERLRAVAFGWERDLQHEAATRIAELENALDEADASIASLTATKFRQAFALECIAAGETSDPIAMACAALVHIPTRSPHSEPAAEPGPSKSAEAPALDRTAARIAELEEKSKQRDEALNRYIEISQAGKARIAELEAALETERIRTSIAIAAERQDCSNILYEAYIKLMDRSKLTKPEEPNPTNAAP